MVASVASRPALLSGVEVGALWSSGGSAVGRK